MQMGLHVHIRCAVTFPDRCCPHLHVVALPLMCSCQSLQVVATEGSGPAATLTRIPQGQIGGQRLKRLRKVSTSANPASATEAEVATSSTKYHSC